jgi:hypothetical protein
MIANQIYQLHLGMMCQNTNYHNSHQRKFMRRENISETEAHGCEVLE